MPNAQTSYEGFDEFMLDRQFRVKFPEDWHPIFADTPRLSIFNWDGLPIIEIFSQTYYQEMLDWFARIDGLFDEEKQAVKESFISRCVIATFDQSGKLSLPPDFCERAGMVAGKPIVLYGRCKLVWCMNLSNFHILLERETSMDSEDPSSEGKHQPAL